MGDKIYIIFEIMNILKWFIFCLYFKGFVIVKNCLKVSVMMFRMEIV